MAIYLDYAATTPLDPAVLEVMRPYLQGHFANASSLHAPGRKARHAVEYAREQVAAAIHASPREIVFTAGATEADNHALRAVAAQHPTGHIVTSQLEHAAVLASCRHLESQGHPVDYLAPTQTGEITPERVAAALREDTVLVALMLVNNETGVLTDIAAVREGTRQHGARLFCDAVQGFGTVPIDVKALGVDLLALSGHKIYGPKGVGVLYVREGLELDPLLLGGEQERGLRAGTLNVPAIVGMGEAAQLAAERAESDGAALRALREHFEAQLGRIEGVSINASEAPRGPKHISVKVSGVDGEALLFGLDQAGVYASSGSACAAGSLEPSHVLRAMGLSREAARSSVRFSLGRGLDRDMLDRAAARFAEVVARCRQYAL